MVALTACAGAPPGAIVGIDAQACRPSTEHGSGALVAPGLVLTAAHVVAGATSITVTRDGHTTDGTIVAFDPEMDLAYVAIDDARPPALTIGDGEVAAGATGVAWVIRNDERVDVPVRITRQVTIRTEDIYIEGETLRPGYELEADIHAGDSGGAVVVNGRVVGVVWARSRNVDGRAYAIDAVRAADVVTEQLDAGEIDSTIDLTRCA